MQCYFHPPPPCSTQSLLSGITFDFHQDCFNITTSNQQYPTQHPNWTHYWLQTSWTPSQLTQRTLPQTSSIPVSPTSRKTSHHFSTISLISKLGCICFCNTSSKNYITITSSILFYLPPEHTDPPWGKRNNPLTSQHRLHYQELLIITPWCSRHPWICRPHQSERNARWWPETSLPVHMCCPRLCHHGNGGGAVNVWRTLSLPRKSRAGAMGNGSGVCVCVLASG